MKNKATKKVVLSGQRVSEATKNPSQVTISHRFPFLSQQTGLSHDVVADLNLTESEFGSRYKRGKSARLEYLQVLENRFELAVLRHRSAQNEKLVTQLNRVLSVLPNGLWQLLCQPNTLEQADAIFRLSFLATNDSFPEFQLDPDSMQDKLQMLVADDLNKAILRNILLNISDEVSVQDIADRNEIGRQAVYDRQNRIVNRLEKLTTDTDFVTLIEYIRMTACVRKATHIEVVMSHPLAQVLQLQPNHFPSIWDLVAIGFWRIAHDETGKNKSFRMKVKDKRHVLIAQRSQAR